MVRDTGHSEKRSIPQMYRGITLRSVVFFVFLRELCLSEYYCIAIEPYRVGEIHSWSIHTERREAKAQSKTSSVLGVLDDVTDVKNWPGAKTESRTKQSQSQGTDPRSICRDWTAATGMTEVQVAVPLAL